MSLLLEANEGIFGLLLFMLDPLSTMLIEVRQDIPSTYFNQSKAVMFETRSTKNSILC
jgi:hypothetical protein